MKVNAERVVAEIFGSHPEVRNRIIPVDRDKINLGLRMQSPDDNVYHFRNLLFTASDVLLLDPDDDPGSGFLSIIHESRPSRAAAYRSLKFRRDQLRFLRRRVLQRLSKKAYNALVRKYATRRTIRVWDHTYRETYVFSFVRTAQLQRPIALSKLEYLVLLHRQTKSALKRVILSKSIKYLREHPKKDTPGYKIVYVDDGATVNQQALAHTRKIPNMVRKVITDHDWSKIRREWVSLQVSVQLKLAELDKEIDSLTNQIARESISSCNRPLPSNKMVQVGARELLAKPQRFCELIRYASWFGLGSDSYLAPVGYALDVGHLPAMSLFYPDRVYLTWLLPEGFTPRAGCKATIQSIAENGRLVQQLPHSVMVRLENYGFRVMENWVGEYTKYTADPSPIIDEIHSQPGVAVPPDSGRYYTRQGLVDRDIAYATKITNLDEGITEEVFDDLTSLNTNQLLALDISEAKADRIVFNATRSLGELKDTPDSIRTIRELPSFAKQALGSRYYEISGRNSRFIARPNSLYKGVPAGQLASNKRLQALLGVTIKRHTLTKLSVVRHLAALYLCWKFGISQSLSDAELVLKKGVREVTKLRRGLGQLASHLDASRVYHPIRRMWRLCSDSVRLALKKRESSIVEQLPPSVKRVVIVDTIDYTEEIHRIMRGESLSRADVIKTGQSGLIYVNNNLLQPADQVPQSTLDALVRHNDKLLLEKLGAGDSDVYIRNEARGVVYAWFSWRTILRSLTDGIANVATKTKAFLTIWELAPVSFVVEWFSNIRSLILSAQALLERTTTKISPVGKPWVMLSNRLWAGCAGGRRRAELRCSDEKFATYAITSSETSAAVDRRAAAIFKICTQRRFEWTLSAEVPQKVTLYRTGIRRAIRCPAESAGELPRFRVGCNINAGKLSSLLAMFVSK